MKSEIHKFGQLPKGAKLLRKPLQKKIGGWTTLVLDAVLNKGDYRWYRVKDGFGEHGDREDWVADVPARLCISVSDYMFREPFWGFEHYKSFESALSGQLKRAIIYARNDLKKRQLEVESLSKFLADFKAP